MTDEEASKLKQMAASWIDGHDGDPNHFDQAEAAWDDAWMEAARRLIAAVDEMHPNSPHESGDDRWAA